MLPRALQAAPPDSPHRPTGAPLSPYLSLSLPIFMLDVSNIESVDYGYIQSTVDQLREENYTP
jgi:hypothetical protein